MMLHAPMVMGSEQLGQRLDVDRLGEMRVEPGGPGALAVFLLAPPGLRDEEDITPFGCRAKAPRHLEAVHAPQA